MSAKLEQIQGIRALAMLGIFLAHTTMWLPDSLSRFTPLVLRLGGSGVATFFIISGFLLAYRHKLVPTISKRNVISAAWKKVSKMYVLYLITIIVCLLAKLPSSVYDWMVTFVFLTFHVTLTQDFIPFAALINAFNAPAWYLSALFGIWMLIYLFPQSVNSIIELSSKKCIIALVALISIQILWMLLVEYGISPIMPKRYLAWCHRWLVYYNPITCLSEYLVGALLGCYCAQRQISVATQNTIALTTLCVVIAYVMALMNSTICPIITIMVIAECLACAGIVAVMSPQSIGYRILTMRAIVWFGNVSGYFFLIHTAVIFMMRAIKDYVTPGWLILISFAVSIFFSACASYIYERFQNNKNGVTAI